jgi:DNA-binding response OmpR family regulator
MTEKRPQVLCVGNEPDLLELRRAILQQAGYACLAARLEEAETPLRSGRFDVVIVSARVDEHEKRWVTSLAQDTPLLFLNGVTFPRDLLKEVSDLIAGRAARMSATGAEPLRSVTR